MWERSYSGRADSIWQSDTRLRPVEVVVCTTTGTFAGRTYRLDYQRLLDALNQGLAPKGVPFGRDFMPLTQVEVSSPDGSKSSLASTFVGKTNILFVGETNKGQGNVSKDGGDGRGPRWREKKPVSTEVHVSSRIIVGDMHTETWQELLEILDSDGRFLPLTSVRISPGLATGDSEFDFVAVNKAQIDYLGQPPVDPLRPFGL
jgi:hypothetical protein